MLLSASTITRRRYTASVGSDGRDDFTSDDTSIRASVQPASDQQVLSLEDGDRTRDPRCVVTHTELRAATDAGGDPADDVILPGGTYAVRRVYEDPPLGPLPATWTAVVVRRLADEEGP